MMEFSQKTGGSSSEEAMIEVEDHVDTLKEFVMETLISFGKRLNALEDKHNSDVSDLKEEIGNMSIQIIREPGDSCEQSEQLETERRVTSTPNRSLKRSESPICISRSTSLTSKKSKGMVVPNFVDEIQDLSWKERLQTYSWLVLDRKEKCTQAQLAFFLYWFDHQSIPLTGKRDEAQRLLHDGMEAGFWFRGWAPEGITDFIVYLQDKIKSQKRKLKRMTDKGNLCKQLEDAIGQIRTTEQNTSKNAQVTLNFTVRRSERRCKSQLQDEKETALLDKILGGCEDGLKVVDIHNKGRGVLTCKPFLRGDFVVQYDGDLINNDEAKHREDTYSKNSYKGCFMFYFNFNNKKYCIDATVESGKFGRLLNHSKRKGNCHPKLVIVQDHPYLILVASRDISVGEELTYDYGDRSKVSIDSHSWLKS